jgi:hypothetical protein
MITAVSKANSKTTTPPTPEEIKRQFQAVQLVLFTRSLKSVDFDNPLRTKEDLTSYQATLLHMNLNKELGPADLQAQNQGIRNLRELIVGVEAKPPFDANDAVIQFVQSIKNTQLKNALIGYLRDESRSQENL